MKNLTYRKSLMGALLLVLTATYMPTASALKLVINTGDQSEHGGNDYPSSGPYYWKQYQGSVPRNAFVGGNEGDMVAYICQASYHGNVHPGKVINGTCYISYGGSEIQRPKFKVLVGRDLEWRNPDRGMPHRAIVGGFENGPLFVCHARFGHRGMIPGKVVAGACNIPYQGKEIPLYNYQVLVSFQ